MVWTLHETWSDYIWGTNRHLCRESIRLVWQRVKHTCNNNTIIDGYISWFDGMWNLQNYRQRKIYENDVSIICFYKILCNVYNVYFFVVIMSQWNVREYFWTVSNLFIFTYTFFFYSVKNTFIYKINFLYYVKCEIKTNNIMFNSILN